MSVLPRDGTVSHRDRSGLDGPTRQTAEYPEPTQKKWGKLIEHFGQRKIDRTRRLQSCGAFTASVDLGAPAVLPQTWGRLNAEPKLASRPSCTSIDCPA